MCKICLSILHLVTQQNPKPARFKSYQNQRGHRGQLREDSKPGDREALRFLIRQKPSGDERRDNIVYISAAKGRCLDIHYEITALGKRLEV